MARVQITFANSYLFTPHYLYPKRYPTIIGHAEFVRKQVLGLFLLILDIPNYIPRKKYNHPIEKVYFINYIVIIDAKYKQGGEYERNIIDNFGIIIGNIFIISINCMGSSSVCR